VLLDDTANKATNAQRRRTQKECQLETEIVTPCS